MGEPDAGTPAAVVDAAIAALNKGRTRYAPMTGSPELRNAIAAQTTSRYGRDTQPREIILTHGGSAGLAATIIALITNPGTDLFPLRGPRGNGRRRMRLGAQPSGRVPGR